ncbi:Uncharacterised protein [Brucella suis]|nr:Uncharacterised protein [Brucella suis]
MAGVMTASPKKQCRTANADAEDKVGPAFESTAHQRHERENAAFAVIVGAQHEQDIFDRHHQRQRPEDERNDAENIAAGQDSIRCRRMKSFAESIYRAGADIAIDDAKRTQHQRFHAFIMLLAFICKRSTFKDTTGRHSGLRRCVIAI